MEPCRRRAIWAAQSQEKRNEPQNEIVQSTDDSKYAAQATHKGSQSNADESPHADAQGHAEKGDVSPYACPKCGKEYRRGMYFHKKYCRGK